MREQLPYDGPYADHFNHPWADSYRRRMVCGERIAWKDEPRWRSRERERLAEIAEIEAPTIAWVRDVAHWIAGVMYLYDPTFPDLLLAELGGRFPLLLDAVKLAREIYAKWEAE